MSVPFPNLCQLSTALRQTKQKLLDFCSGILKGGHQYVRLFFRKFSNGNIQTHEFGSGTAVSLFDYSYNI